MSCVCGLGETTESCCGRYVLQGQEAPTAEALMRSRYAAYVLGEIDYIEKTHNPTAREEVDRDGAEEWSKQAEWDGLEVHESQEDGDAGIVEFTARYIVQGRLFRHRERAEFKRIDGNWRYMDGDMVKAKPVVRQQRKVGRNEPCICGSGKKYKKCCGR